MIRNAIIFWVAAGFSMPATAADTFDLICTGEAQVHLNKPATPSKIRFTVDLKNKLYCSAAEYEEIREKCNGSLPIVEVEQSRLWLIKDEAPKPLWYLYVNRTDATYVWFSMRPYHNEKGKCELAAFSGFPASKF